MDRWPLWWWRASTVLTDPRMPTVLCWQWCEWYIVKSTLKFGLSFDLHRAPSDAFQKVVANSLQQCQTLKLSNLLTALANLTTLFAASYWTLRRFLGAENGQMFFQLIWANPRAHRALLSNVCCRMARPRNPWTFFKLFWTHFQLENSKHSLDFCDLAHGFLD